MLVALNVGEGLVVRLTRGHTRVYHQSDEPGFSTPPLTPREMRERMYQCIEQAIADVAEPDRRSVKCRVNTWLAELRRIDFTENGAQDQHD